MNELHCDENCPFTKHQEHCIDSIRLFKELPPDAKNRLLEHHTRTVHPKNERIVSEGDAIDEVLVITKGRIKTCHIDSNGDEHILDVLHEGQAIWHGMFLPEHTYQYDIVTLTPVVMCRISRQDFMEVLRTSPETAMYLIEMLSKELQDANEKAFLFSIRHPEERIAAFLLFRDTRCISSTIDMKLDDIAASIGLRRETISRYLSQLEKKNLIRREGNGRLRVIDRDALKSLYTL